MDRSKTKVIHIGDKVIGGGNPILIQSMTNVPTEDTQRCVEQILRVEEGGCEIIRCTVPNEEAALSISRIKKQLPTKRLLKKRQLRKKLLKPKLRNRLQISLQITINLRARRKK